MDMQVLSTADDGNKSLLRAVLQADIRNIENLLRPGWLLRQMERAAYNIAQGAKAFAAWLKPRVVEEKVALFKAPEVVKEVVAPVKARVRELPQLKVEQVLKVAAKQEDKRQLLKKECKNELLPKKSKQKSGSLSVR